MDGVALCRTAIEITNTTPLPAKIYAGKGIAQMIFVRGVEDCRTSYADKKGKYQDQEGSTLPFVMNASDEKAVAKIPKAAKVSKSKKKQ